MIGNIVNNQGRAYKCDPIRTGDREFSISQPDNNPSRRCRLNRRSLFAEVTLVDTASQSLWTPGQFY